MHIEKEEVKVSLFVYDKILHRRDLKDSTRKLFKMTHTFSNTARYKDSTGNTSCTAADKLNGEQGSNPIHTTLKNRPWANPENTEDSL